MCAKLCPQKINVPELMPEMTKAFEKLPSWVKVCQEREAAAKNAAVK